MAARVVLAVAHPFHIGSSPTRVTPSGRLGTTASAMAWRICSWLKCNTFPAAQAAPMKDPTAIARPPTQASSAFTAP